MYNFQLIHFDNLQEQENLSLSPLVLARVRYSHDSKCARSKGFLAWLKILAKYSIGEANGAHLSFSLLLNFLNSSSCC